MNDILLWGGLFLIAGGPFIGIHQPFQTIGAVAMAFGVAIVIINSGKKN